MQLLNGLPADISTIGPSAPDPPSLLFSFPGKRVACFLFPSPPAQQAQAQQPSPQEEQGAGDGDGVDGACK